MYDRRVVVALVAGVLAGLASCDAREPAAVQEVVGPQSSVVSAGPALGLALVTEGLTQPVSMSEPPDGTGRLMVVDQSGMIRVIDESGELLAEPFLDVRDRMVALSPFFDERGLLGLAFHPGYAENGRFFIYYSAPPRLADYDNTSTIAEYAVTSDPNVADPASERILLEIDQPQANHNAGTLHFGPADGYLYISVGDGGGAHDVGFGHVEDWYAVNDGGNGQDVTENLLGNILRIDVDGGTPYGIPPDNPFVAESGLDEIWAFGLRNPYRFSFDQGGSHVLLAGDAGQHLWEEVSVIERGGNYGWNVKEGPACFSTEHPREPLEDCPDMDPDGRPLRDPVIAYPNAAQPDGLGVVVIGGYVYRGDRVPQLEGRYIFGDFSRSFAPADGVVLMARPGGSAPWRIQELHFPARDGDRLGEYLLGFGQDAAGEVYLLTSETLGPTGTSGRVYRLAQPGLAR